MIMMLIKLHTYNDNDDAIGIIFIVRMIILRKNEVIDNKNKNNTNNNSNYNKNDSNSDDCGMHNSIIIVIIVMSLLLKSQL